MLALLPTRKLLVGQFGRNMEKLRNILLNRDANDFRLPLSQRLPLLFEIFVAIVDRLDPFRLMRDDPLRDFRGARASAPYASE